MRKVFLIVGAVLGVVVAAGIFFFLQATRPTLVEVPVAANDIPSGTVLRANLFRLTRIANIDRQTASQWVLLSDWSMAEGKVTTSDVRAGFPVAKAQIDPNSASGIETRLSLVVTGSNEYYIALPVKPDEIGNYVQPGDRIDLVVNIGSGDKKDEWVMKPVTETEGALEAGSATTNVSQPGLIAATDTETMTPPISKLIMQNMTVLRVDREKSRDTSASSPAGSTEAESNIVKPVNVLNDVKRIYVKVNRDQLEILSFVMNNGKRNIAVRAAHGTDEVPPTDGVTWDDFTRWFYAQRGNDTDGVQPFNAISPAKPRTAVTQTLQVQQIQP
jgi:Flp pilus assembly protein CpaB